MLTKESDVYSFGVVLMEVLCGRLCFNYINGQLNILVRTWNIAYNQKKLHEIVFQGRMPPMNSSSLDIFSDVAFQCLRRSPEERPTMAHVIEKLEIALAFQKSSITYEDGLKDMVSSLKYRSVKVHKMLFTRGIYLNGGKKWFSLNDKGEHCEMISISDCLIPYESEDYTPRYSANQMSRFTSGSYLTGGKQFKTHVRTQYLSPLVTYTVSLVFRCPIKLKEKFAKQQYISLNYELEGETKILIVHLVDFPEDGWLMGELYRFTSDQSIVDVEILFKNHACCSDLEIDGIEFHPLENVELEVLEYQQILKAMARPLIYRSQEELKVLLSKGVLLNRGKTWFSLNDSGEHCEMISIAECLVPRQDFYEYLEYNSRFAIGCFYLWGKGFKTHVTTQFLSPQITYTVNLVFKFMSQFSGTDVHPAIRYKLKGETRTSNAFLFYEREDEWLMAELYQFTSDGTTVSLEIMFDCFHGMIVEGIDFQPLEKVEDEVLEDAKLAALPISDSDTYWEQIFPDDYEDIFKRSKVVVELKTRSLLYPILRKGFLINNDQEWFSLDKNGKKCPMISARAAFVVERSIWKSIPESRFGEAVMVDGWQFSVVNEVNPQLLSPQTAYACYLVYKLLEEHIHFDHDLLLVSKREFSFDGQGDDLWYICLVAPQTPVIRLVGNQNDHNTLNRPIIKHIPQNRSDGWPEVQIWEFQTGSATQMIQMIDNQVSPRMHLGRSAGLHGLLLQGIECRSV